MLTADFVTIDNGRVTAAAPFLPVLQAAGLDTFDRFMALPARGTVRAVPGRSTVRVELPSLTAYLKRYEPNYLSTADRVLRALHWPGADDEASREWRKMLLLREHGFLTATPVAAGQSRRGGIVLSSFLMQQEISGGQPADEVLPKLPLPRKRRLLRRLGALARRLRDAGFIHKDLYLKHIFVVERGDDWDLYLIDLQRVLGPRRHRKRWYLKDAAALAHSARARTHCSKTDLLRLYQGYASGAMDRTFIRKVWSRMERLQRHPPKYKRVWNE
jgi:tRNA A-37 threonylcarbamoyl transferase component Bud32